jgi:outer membrane cobalamin receptor
MGRDPSIARPKETRRDMRVLAVLGFVALAAVVTRARADGSPPDPPAPPAEAPPRPEPSAPPPAEPGEVVVQIRGTSGASSSPAARAPGAAVTTIDADRFAGEAKTTAALLATAPGVAVTEHGGPGQLSLVSIRGSSAEQVKVLVDGLQLNGAAGGGVDLSTLPASWISRIEVVRGTEGVHHGTGALGGVVDVITLPVKPGTWGASATAGSFGTWQGAAHLAAGGEGWGLLGAVTGGTTDGRFRFEDPVRHTTELRRHDASREGGGLLKAFWRVGGGRLDAAAQGSAGRRELPGSLQAPTPHDEQEEARGLVTARWRRPLGEGPALAAGGWLRADRLEVKLEELGGDPRLQRGLAGGGSLGLSWQGERAALSASAEAGGERLDADGMGDRTRVTTAAVLAGELSAWGGRVKVAPGVRLERAGRFQGISAKLGGAAELWGPLSVRASAGRTYRVPSFAELYLQQGVVSPNPDLRAETGLGGDGALVLQGWAGSLSLGAFAVRYDDLIVYEAASFRRFVPRNATRSSARGLEVEGASAPARRLAGLSVAGAYTLLDTETLRGPAAVVGRELPQKPRHRLHGRVSGGGDPVELHADVQWLSRRWVDLTNTRSIPAAFTLDAGGAVRVWREPDVHLNLEVRNLLDERTAEDGFMNPLPGRAVFVTVRAGAAQ